MKSYKSTTFDVEDEIGTKTIIVQTIIKQWEFGWSFYVSIIGSCLGIMTSLFGLYCDYKDKTLPSREQFRSIRLVEDNIHEDLDLEGPGTLSGQSTSIQ